MEARFGSLPGVVRTRVGYAGGTTPHPTYKKIGDHTETVEVDFDPTRISYQELLNVFWAAHRPDIPGWSRQYMNVIFYHGQEQKTQAEASLGRARAQYGRVHTLVLPATPFTLAEDYHQKYYLRQVPPLLRELQTYYPELQGLVHSTAAARVNGYVAGYGTSRQLEEELPLLGLSPESSRWLRARFKAAALQAPGCPVGP